MLRLNRETDYAIRVILALAKYPPGQIIPSGVIRQEMFLPESLSIQIISHLAHLGLINSFPGRKGGIQLAKQPSEISLYDVVRGMEGPLILSECLEEEHQCQLAPGCPVQGYWIDLQSRVIEQMREMDFQKLLKTSPQPINEHVK